MLTTEVTKVPFLATYPPCIYHVLVGWIIGRKLQGSHHCIHNWSLQNSVPIIWWCDIPILRYMPRKSNIGFFCWLVYFYWSAESVWTKVENGAIWTNWTIGRITWSGSRCLTRVCWTRPPLIELVCITKYSVIYSDYASYKYNELNLQPSKHNNYS